MPENYDPVVYPYGGCGCEVTGTLLVCGPFEAPVNPDQGHCHAHHVHIDCEAPVVTVEPVPAVTSWSGEEPVFSIPSQQP